MAQDNTLARSLHDLGLATWFGGSLMGAVGLNGADNGLHLVSAVAGVAIALLPADRAVTGRGGVADRRT